MKQIFPFLWKAERFCDHTGLNDQTSVLRVYFYFYCSLVLIFKKGESMQFFYDCSYW